jgi:hypothetical protein
LGSEKLEETKAKSQIIEDIRQVLEEEGSMSQAVAPEIGMESRASKSILRGRFRRLSPDYSSKLLRNSVN